MIPIQHLHRVAAMIQQTHKFLEIPMIIEQRSPLETLAAYALAFAAGALTLAASHAYAEWRLWRENGDGF